jgi:D-alanyl-D-alanine carboxypeptidase
MKRSIFLTLCMALCLFFGSCSRKERPGPPEEGTPEGAFTEILETGDGVNKDGGVFDQLKPVLEKAGIPPELARRVTEAALEGPAFILDLLAILEGDPYLRFLVDKRRPLPQGYEPEDLVELTGPSYLLDRPGLRLRRPAAAALEGMAAAARAEGISLRVASAYRSAAYQEEVYTRNVREMGREAADRESAPPGRSQHQLGLVADFGPIDDSFAETAAGRWVAANAGRFGWSLSFPQGYEGVTGYRWESWHYRYVGRELYAFIETYFGGIQQYALAFIHEWAEAFGPAGSPAPFG